MQLVHNFVPIPTLIYNQTSNALKSCYEPFVTRAHHLTLISRTYSNKKAKLLVLQNLINELWF